MTKPLPKAMENDDDDNMSRKEEKRIKKITKTGCEWGWEWAERKSLMTNSLFFHLS